ncbi:hypothetical protein ACP4OV_024483 [Aristida adscensionis]
MAARQAVRRQRRGLRRGRLCDGSGAVSGAGRGVEAGCARSSSSTMELRDAAKDTVEDGRSDAIYSLDDDGEGLPRAAAARSARRHRAVAPCAAALRVGVEPV